MNTYPFRALAFAVVVTTSLNCLADGETGKVKICRNSAIISTSDRVKTIKVEGLVQFQSIKSDNDSLWIGVEDLKEIGPPGNCQTMEGTILENKAAKPLPKKGSRWIGEASAEPGTWWGQRPISTSKTEIKGDWELSSVTTVGDPRKGGEVRTVYLSATVVEDFK